MVNLLRRIFIKDYKNVDNEIVRGRHGKFAAFFGIVTNLILVLLKGGVALYGASKNHWVFSLALIADTVNNLGDLASNLVTLFGFKMAMKPADKDHPFGHQRIEYISGLIVSIFVVATGLELFSSSIQAAINKAEVTYDLLAIIILFISSLIKLGQGYVNYGLGKAISSPSLKATCLDSISDAIATTILGIGAIITYCLNFPYLDSYLGLAISLFIIYSGIMMIKETSDPLIGHAANKEDVEKIVKEILSYKEIKGVHDVICHNYGPTKIFISLHVEVDEKNDLAYIHDVIDNIEEDIRKKFAVEITIHMDPISIGNKEVDETKNKVLTLLAKLDKSLTIHDFRMVKGPTHVNVIFDIVVPYDDKSFNEVNVLNTLEAGFLDEPIKHNFIVRFDHPYEE